MLSCSNPGSSHPSLISAWQPEGQIQGPRDPETVEDTTIHWISGKLDGKIQWKNREAMFFPMKKRGVLVNHSLEGMNLHLLVSFSYFSYHHRSSMLYITVTTGHNNTNHLFMNVETKHQ